MASKLKVVLLYLLLVTNFIILKKKEVKSVRTLFISFKNELGDIPVSAFRGAVIEKVGREHTIFNNHLGDDKFVYQYPLIQYKKVGTSPSIFCIESGVDEIHKLFEQRSWTIQVYGEKHNLKVDRVDLKNIRLNVWERMFEYNIWNWQALNEENWLKYLQLETMVEKIAMLEKILIGNIISFAKGVEWDIEKPIKLTIKDVKLERFSKMKDIKVKTFGVQFRTNVSLPNYLGLGKGVSKGFGIVKNIRNINEE